MFSIASGIQIVFDVWSVDVFWLINAILAKGNSIVKMTSSSRVDGRACSRWKMVRCEWFRKYIHRCFSCQNLIQSHEFIRRIRAGRIYHADCLMCSKCKRTLQNDDINALIRNNSFFNDLDYLCQSCSNSSTNQSVLRTMSSSNVDEGGRRLVVPSKHWRWTLTFPIRRDNWQWALQFNEWQETFDHISVDWIESETSGSSNTGWQFGTGQCFASINKTHHWFSSDASRWREEFDRQRTSLITFHGGNERSCASDKIHCSSKQSSTEQQ